MLLPVNTQNKSVLLDTALVLQQRNNRRLDGAACHHEVHWVQSVPKSQHYSVALSFHLADNGLPGIN
jgi:hypothetical protein